LVFYFSQKRVQTRSFLPIYQNEKIDVSTALTAEKGIRSNDFPYKFYMMLPFFYLF